MCPKERRSEATRVLAWQIVLFINFFFTIVVLPLITQHTENCTVYTKLPATQASAPLAMFLL